MPFIPSFDVISVVVNVCTFVYILWISVSAAEICC